MAVDIWKCFGYLQEFSRRNQENPQRIDAYPVLPAGSLAGLYESYYI